MVHKRIKKSKLFRSSLLDRKIESKALYRQHHVHDLPVRTVGIKRFNFVLTTYDSTILNYNQIEACRKIVARRMRRQKPHGSYLTCLKFTLPVTCKSKNSRMGKGKGGVSMFVARVKTFDTLFVLRNVTYACATRILIKIAHKLPIRVCICIQPTKRYNSMCAH